MDDNKQPANTDPVAVKLTTLAQPAAETLLELLKLSPSPIPVGTKLHQALDEIRSYVLDAGAKHVAHAEVQVDIKPEQVKHLMNDKEANEWLDIAITAISANDYQKAEQYWVKFNNACPSDQVKMILNKIQLKISQMPKAQDNENEKKTDPDMIIVDRFIDIAYKAIAAKDMTKAQDLWAKAEKVKPTQKTKKLLEDINQIKPKLQTDTAEKLTEFAMAAIADDQYDVAVMLLKTAWIQCHSESAKKTCHLLVQGGIPQRRQIIRQIKEQRKSATEQFVKLAEKLIGEGHHKVAESILVIARYTDLDNPQVGKLMDGINILYPCTADSNVQWVLYNLGGCIPINPLNSVAIYKAVYFVEMARRAFVYADDAKLALEFLEEADRIWPNNGDIKSYIEKVKER